MIPYGKHTTSWVDAFRVAVQVKSNSLTQGKTINEFESQVANYVGSKYAVAVSSATAGLHLALLALKLPKLAKVITSPISFVSTSNAILYTGNHPIFIDIDEHTGNMSADEFDELCQNEKKIDAVIPVHLTGQPCDMVRINKTANEKGIKIIEDAAHALGGQYPSGSRIGSCEYSLSLIHI